MTCSKGDRLDTGLSEMGRGQSTCEAGLQPSPTSDGAVLKWTSHSCRCVSSRHRTSGTGCPACQERARLSVVCQHGQTSSWHILTSALPKAWFGRTRQTELVGEQSAGFVASRRMCRINKTRLTNRVLSRRKFGAVDGAFVARQFVQELPVVAGPHNHGAVTCTGRDPPSLRVPAGPDQVRLDAERRPVERTDGTVPRGERSIPYDSRSCPPLAGLTRSEVTVSRCPAIEYTGAARPPRASDDILRESHM